MQLLNAQATIRALQNLLEQEKKRHLESWDILDSIIDQRKQEIDGYQELARQLADTVARLKTLRPSARAMLERAAKFEPEWYGDDELVHVVRGLIDGPVKEAISQANSVEPSESRKQVRDRKDYMREYMQKKRAAEAKAR
jgi:hypothetical protein